MYQATLAASIKQFGKLNVEYNLTDDENARPNQRISLTFKDDVSADEINAAIQTRIDRLEVEYQESIAPQPDYYAIMQQVLDGNIAPGTYDVVRTALKDMGGEMVKLGDSISLNISAQASEPEDIDLMLRTRIEDRLGPGSYDGVRAVLKALNINTVEIARSVAKIEL